jgi:hypothetical protein
MSLHKGSTIAFSTKKKDEQPKSEIQKIQKKKREKEGEKEMDILEIRKKKRKERMQYSFEALEDFLFEGF